MATSYKCDACNAESEAPSKNWIVVLICNGSSNNYVGSWVEIYPFTDTIAQEGQYHYCSFNCLRDALKKIVAQIKPSGRKR